MSLTTIPSSTAEPAFTLGGALMAIENDGFGPWASPVTTIARIMAVETTDPLIKILTFPLACFRLTRLSLPPRPTFQAASASRRSRGRRVHLRQLRRRFLLLSPILAI